MVRISQLCTCQRHSVHTIDAPHLRQLLGYPDAPHSTALSGSSGPQSHICHKCLAMPTCPLYMQGSDKLQCRSLGVIKRLKRIQCMVAITILGAMHTSPTDTLDLHTFLPPMLILLQEILHQSMACMVMLPKSHPLCLKIDWIEKHDMQHHKSALHHLIHTLDL